MTIFDIAEHFNVNVSTVSKALNGSTDIKESTRKAICAFAESVGYKSRRGRAKKGNLVVLQNNIFKSGRADALITEIFKREAEAANYTVTVVQPDVFFKLDEFLSQPYKGIFVLGDDYKTQITRKIREFNIPIVVLGSRLFDHPLVSYVKPNDLGAATEAVDYLYSIGHKRIAFLGMEKDSLVDAERFAGYFFGITNNSLSYLYELTHFGDMTAQAGKEAAYNFLTYRAHFSAILCTSEAAAAGFVEYLRYCYKHVPNDFSVICFSDGNTAEDSELTRLTPDLVAIGKNAFAALNAMLQGFPSQQICVPYHGVNLTGTCRARRCNDPDTDYD